MPDPHAPDFLVTTIFGLPPALQNQQASQLSKRPTRRCNENSPRLPLTAQPQASTSRKTQPGYSISQDSTMEHSLVSTEYSDKSVIDCQIKKFCSRLSEVMYSLRRVTTS